MYGPVSIPCNDDDNSINVYPNPAAGSFKVEITSLENQYHAAIEIIDLAGKIISSQEVNIMHGVNQFPFSTKLSAGTYLIRINAKGSAFAPQKLVIQ